jgi:hypothetical protein
VQYFKEIPIDFIPGTNKTVIVSLLDVTDTGYRIRMQNGDSVELDKTWVQTVIWKANPLMLPKTSGLTPNNNSTTANYTQSQEEFATGPLLIK